MRPASRHKWAVGALGIAVMATLWAALWAVPASATEVVRVVSAKGIEAWLVEEHSIPLIAVEVSFRGGAGLDPVGKEGLAGLVSSLVDEGAGDLDSLAFQERLEDLAVRLGFSASMESFSGSLRTLTENRDEAFDLLRMALAAPRFDEEPVERIRRQVIAGIVRRLEDPGRIARETWYKHLMGNHPYARPLRGTQESVAAITAGDLHEFVANRFARDKMMISVVGDIDAGTLAILLDRTFAGLPAKSGPVELPAVNIIADGTLEVVKKPNPQSSVRFGHKGLKRDDKDWFAAYVLNYILGGGGFESRLMAEVREKRGLAYGISTSFHPFWQAGIFVGMVATENARVAETIQVVREEIARMAAAGATELELKEAKDYLTGSFPLSLDSNSKIANTLIAMQYWNLGLDYLDHRNGYIEAVTLDDVRRVAKRLLHADNLVFVVVGDPEGLGDGG